MKRRGIVLLTLLATCILLSATAGGQEGGYAPPSGEARRDTAFLDSDRSCGIKIIYLVGSWFGRPVRVRDLLLRMPPSEEGISMYDIREALREMGLRVEARRLNAVELKGNNKICVLFIQRETGGGHFVLYVPPDIVVDPPQYAAVEQGGLEALGWTGLTLVVDDPRSSGRPREPGILVVQPQSIDWGDVHESNVFAHDFALKNVGDTPVDVKSVRSSCSCVTAHTSKKHFAPGEEGHLSLQLSVGPKTSRYSGVVILETNSVASPFVKVAVAARLIGRLIAVPDRILFENVLPSDLPVKKRCTVVSTDAEQEVVIRAASVTMESVDCRATEENRVEVCLRKIPHASRTSGLIVISTNLGEAQVPVTVTLRQRFVIRPKVLVFRPGEPEAKELLLSSQVGPIEHSDFSVTCDESLLHVTPTSTTGDSTALLYSVRHGETLAPGGSAEIVFQHRDSGENFKARVFLLH